MAYPRVAGFKTHAEFTRHLSHIRLDLPCEELVEHGPDSLLAQSIEVHDFKIGNRFCILPMEGCDGAPDAKLWPER